MRCLPPPNKIAFTLGVYTSVSILVKNEKSSRNASVSVHADGYTTSKRQTVFYNLPHVIIMGQIMNKYLASDT